MPGLRALLSDPYCRRFLHNLLLMRVVLRAHPLYQADIFQPLVSGTWWCTARHSLFDPTRVSFAQTAPGLAEESFHDVAVQGLRLILATLNLQHHFPLPDG